MSQITHGLRAILNSPIIYNTCQKIVGIDNLFNVLVGQYAALKSNAKILDIGCGPGTIVKYLPADVSYFGYDLSEEYIKAAKKKYAHRGSFFVEDVNKLNVSEGEAFDIIFGLGLLHHLNDNEAVRFFLLAQRLLKKGGVVVTIDPAFSPEQSAMARAIISRDRGQNVRVSMEYEAIARKVFGNARHEERHDLLRIPFTHCIVKAGKD